MIIHVAFFLPHLDAGGVERIVLTLLQRMDRKQFLPHLFLTTRRGSFLKQIPEGVTVIDFGGISMRRITPILCHSLKKYRISVVYGGTNAANLALLVAQRLMKSPPAIVVSEHTPLRLFLDAAKWKWLRLSVMRYLYKHADAIAVPIAAIGEELADLLRQKNLPIAVLPNPVVDVEEMSGARSSEKAPWGDVKGTVFVTAGRLVRLKGFDILIKAFDVLSANDATIRLVILGEGPEREFLMDLIIAKGLKEKVLLPGVVDEPISYFRHADCFVLSSRREGFGIVLIEAMAAGIPVISTDCPFGPRQLLQDGEAGLLVKPESPEDLAIAMRQVMTDKKLASTLVAKGRQRARDFDIKSSIVAFESLFYQLYEDRKQTAGAHP